MLRTTLAPFIVAERFALSQLDCVNQKSSVVPLKTDRPFALQGGSCVVFSARLGVKSSFGRKAQFRYNNKGFNPTFPPIRIVVVSYLIERASQLRIRPRPIFFFHTQGRT